MKEMSLAERIFRLRRSPAFSELYDSELGAIGGALRPKGYGPGEVIARAGQPMRLLHLVVSGRVVQDAGAVPEVFGVNSLLTGEPMTVELRADPEDGAQCLVLTRPHFLTLVNEYPPLLVNLLAEWRRVGGA